MRLATIVPLPCIHETLGPSDDRISTEGLDRFDRKHVLMAEDAILHEHTCQSLPLVVEEQIGNGSEPSACIG
jgi:hypothetical protein